MPLARVADKSAGQTNHEKKVMEGTSGPSYFYIASKPRSLSNKSNMIDGRTSRVRELCEMKISWHTWWRS